ncbi:hypothetical protein DFH06DRAFT_1427304 [Mycena polygramma]|nr:hypothetical protein DFH06DRAFT_1427304 [Mycena polygramma]
MRQPRLPFPPPLGLQAPLESLTEVPDPLAAVDATPLAYAPGVRAENMKENGCPRNILTRAHHDGRFNSGAQPTAPAASTSAVCLAALDRVVRDEDSETEGEDARVGRAEERLETEVCPLMRIPKSVAHFNPHTTLLSRRMEYFRAAGSVPPSAPCGTPHTGLSTLLSCPSHFTPTHNINVRGFRSSAVSAVEEAAPAPRRPRGRPRRDALPSAPDDALTGAEHDDAPRRPRGRPRRDALAAAVPDSPDDALQREKHTDAPRRPRGRPRRDGAPPPPPPPPSSPSKPGAESVPPAVPAPQSALADPIGLWDVDVDENHSDSESDWDPGCEFYIASDSESDADDEWESDVDSQSDSEHESDSRSHSDSESESESDDDPDSDYAPDRRPRWEEALVGDIINAGRG